MPYSSNPLPGSRHSDSSAPVLAPSSRNQVLLCAGIERLRWLARFNSDPRHFQILALGCLLIYGLSMLDFGIDMPQVALTLSSALLAQYLCTRHSGHAPFDARSALISGLSLCLLLRVDDLSFAVLAAVLAIGSKFILRWRDQHIFNPTAFAITVLLLSSDSVWVSPGQWGHAAMLMLSVAGLGLLVLTRAHRLDIALAFASAWSIAVFARAWWYQDPFAIAMHQLSNGAVLLFCLFMITDPRTTPKSRGARIIFAISIAALAALINFTLHRSDALIIALALGAPLSVLLNIDWRIPSLCLRTYIPTWRKS